MLVTCEKLHHFPPIFSKKFTQKNHLTQIPIQSQLQKHYVLPAALNMFKVNNTYTRTMSHLAVLRTFLLTWSTFRTAVST